jgi:ribosomal protein S18 acetylase RimI-like enzyme
VAPEARGQGIGGKLVDFCIAKARAAGKQFLRLYTSNHPNQAIAQILYEKRGFRLIGDSQLRGTQFKKLYGELEL